MKLGIAYFKATVQHISHYSTPVNTYAIAEVIIIIMISNTIRYNNLSF